jgi:hypothetical protein
MELLVWHKREQHIVCCEEKNKEEKDRMKPFRSELMMNIAQQIE